MNSINAYGNYFFEVVFGIVSFPEEQYSKFRHENPLFKKMIQDIEEQVGMTVNELFDEHYNIWLSEIEEEDDYIKYIKKDLEQAERELIPNSERDKKILYLAAKSVKLFADKSIDKNNGNYIFTFENDTVTIDKQTIFHVVWGHYLRLPNITLSERNKSIFEKHKTLEFIEEIEKILKEMNGNYILVKGKEELDIKIGDNYYKLVLQKNDATKYRVVTYFIIDREESIQKLKDDCTVNQITENFALLNKR